MQIIVHLKRSEKTVKRMTIIIAGQEAAVAQLLEQKIKGELLGEVSDTSAEEEQDA